jgi:hypothetical protein
VTGVEVKLLPLGPELKKLLDRFPSFKVTDQPAPSEDAARDRQTIYGARSIGDVIKRASERLDQDAAPAKKSES